MCDFSLQSVRSRPARVGDKLTSRDFGTGTHGFSAVGDPGMAVCILPGTEVAFSADITYWSPNLVTKWTKKTAEHRTAIFRQVNKDKLSAHHDALEFPDGGTVLLTLLCEGQTASVLQMPAKPENIPDAHERAKAAADQKRVAYVG